jgi:hypothetical protein
VARVRFSSALGSRLKLADPGQAATRPKPRMQSDLSYHAIAAAAVQSISRLQHHVGRRIAEVHEAGRLLGAPRPRSLSTAILAAGRGSTSGRGKLPCPDMQAMEKRVQELHLPYIPPHGAVVGLLLPLLAY